MMEDILFFLLYIVSYLLGMKNGIEICRNEIKKARDGKVK